MPIVVINYPDGWKSERFFQNGDQVEVSEEIKAQFIELGIVKADKKEKVQEPQK